MKNSEQNTQSCQTAVGRRLLFYNDSLRQPKQNQRVLLYVANQKDNWLSQLRYTTAVYKTERKTHPSECGWDVSDH